MCRASDDGCCSMHCWYRQRLLGYPIIAIYAGSYFKSLVDIEQVGGNGVLFVDHYDRWLFVSCDLLILSHIPMCLCLDLFWRGGSRGIM